MVQPGHMQGVVSAGLEIIDDSHSAVIGDLQGLYGDATEGCLDALMLMAETEGILLDPVYSAKVFSGLLAHHASGRWSSGQRLVFIHSGGTPAIFAYHNEIKQHLIKRGRTIDA